MKKINKIFLLLKFLIVLLLSFLVIEFFARSFVWIITKDFKTFYYGFSKDIRIDIFHLKKLDIKLTDLYLINEATIKNKSNNNKKIDKNLDLWVFGGSTTHGYNCGKNSSSWTNEINKLDENIIIHNFAEGGIDSDKSLFYLRNAFLNKKKIPEKVIWAHKFNEINVIYQGLKSNKEKIDYTFNTQSKNKANYTILKIDTTFKNNFLSYKILDNFFVTVGRKIIRNIEKDRINKRLTDDDFRHASINYKINTLEAIKLSKANNINEFIIISLPSRLDYQEKMKDSFDKHFNKVIIELKKEEIVKFINLENNEKVLKNENLFFCDEMHKNLKGNIITAEIIYKQLLD